ncbi:hypothetical protein Tco_0659735, partial [Tanacetum coccineum]
SITDIKYVLTQRALDVFCHKYYIPEEVHPELPHPGATMNQRPTGKIRLSRNYALDEDTYPRFEHKNREEMDLSAFIRVLDPTKVKTIERERAEGEAKLLETIVGHTVLLLLIVPAHAEEELEASVDRIFSKDVCKEQTDSAEVGTAAIEQTVIVTDTVVENVAIKKTRRQKKKRYAAADAGKASHPANKLSSDHGTVSGSTTGVGIAAVPTLPFITTSISTTPERDVHDHTDSISGLNLRNVELSKRSLTPSILVMTNVTTTTTVVVLGSTSLSFSLSVLSSRVEKIRANIVAHSLPTPIATTTALSTSFATTSSIIPISTDDYEVVDAENVQRNDTSFLNFEEETLNATL